MIVLPCLGGGRQVAKTELSGAGKAPVDSIILTTLPGFGASFSDCRNPSVADGTGGLSLIVKAFQEGGWSIPFRFSRLVGFPCMRII